MGGLVFLGSVLILITPARLGGECREKPKVVMDERSAESHLITKMDPELPESGSRLVRPHRVVVVVTVDRDGTICHTSAVSGPEALRVLAAKAVKKHWKYRPFLVDWEPVVAQFPVSVHFVRSRTETDSRA